MGIPDFQSIMLPLLDFASDQQEHASRDPVAALSALFKLTDEERTRLTPGRVPVFSVRVAWALTHLRQAGLVQTTRRGHFTITARGLELQQKRLPKIDMRVLAGYEEYRDFRARHRVTLVQTPTGGNETLPAELVVEDTQTPSELLDDAYQTIRQDLAQDLLDTIMACSPVFFERLVIDLLVRMGYGGSRTDAGAAVGHSGDGGIDGIIKEDQLGLDVIYVQAKRWDGTVSRPEIQRFAGALAGQRAHKGVFITTSSYTKDACEFVKGIATKIVLIDGKQLAELMIDYDVGVSTISTYRVKRVDSDYFDEA